MALRGGIFGGEIFLCERRSSLGLFVRLGNSAQFKAQTPPDAACELLDLVVVAH